MGAPVGWNEGVVTKAPVGWDEAAPAITSEPSPISPVEGASPWEVGSVPSMREMKPYVRAGAQMAVGLPAAIGGSIPAGAAAAALAGAGVDLLYGDTPSVTEVGTDFGLGLAVPYAAKGVAKGVGWAADKIVPKPVQEKMFSIVKNGFEKGVRPSVTGKGNAPQVEQYYKRAQSAVESIIKNKQALQFTDDAGNAVAGKLPQNLHQFSQAIDQTKRNVFSQYDEMVRASGDLGRTVDLGGVVSELKAFQGNRVNRMVDGGGMMSGGGIGRADALIERMTGQKLSLSEAQDMIALLNGRLKAFYSNPSPDLASSAAIDALAANRLRSALDSAVEKYGYQELKNQYGALRAIEKEVNNRAIVDARKNTKGLIDFADIASAAEAARAVTTMSAGPAAAGVAIRAMKEWYKYVNNPNRVVRKMFVDAERVIASKGGMLPLKALPPGPRAMPGTPDSSYVRGVPADIRAREGLLALPPKGATIRPIGLLGDFEKKYSVRPQVR